MLPPRYILFTFVIVCFLSLVSSQQCVNGTRYSKVVPLCENYLIDKDREGKLVFLPGGPRFAVESILSNAGLKASRSIAFLDKRCKQAMYPFVCNSVFQLCKEISSMASPTTTPVPIPISRAVCNRVLKRCGATVPLEQLPNCTSIDAVTGQPVYPDTNQTTVFANYQYFNVTPVPVHKNIKAPEFSFECPYPMVNFPKGDEPPAIEWPFPWPCGLRCPSWYFTSTYSDYKTYWRRIIIFNRVCGSVGLVLILINLIGMLISRSQWKPVFPKSMVIGLIILTDVNMISFTIPAFTNEGQVGCVNEYTGAHAYEWKCAITGLFTQSNYAALTLCSMIIINTCIVFLTRNSQTIQARIKYFVTIAVIVPQLALIPYVFVKNDFAGNVNCFYQDTNVLILTISCWMTIIVAGWLVFPIPAVLIYRGLKTGTNLGFNPIKKSLKQVFFAIVFLSMYTISTSLGAHDLVQKNAAVEEISNFLTCVITQFVAETTLSVISGTKPCIIDVPLSKYAPYHYIGSGILILLMVPFIFWNDFSKGFKDNTDMDSIKKWTTKSSQITTKSSDGQKSEPKSESK